MFWGKKKRETIHIHTARFSLNQSLTALFFLVRRESDIMMDSTYLSFENYFMGRNGYICDPTTIQLLFEISQALYDGIDFVNVKDDDNQPARLISRFVNMVTYSDVHFTLYVFQLRTYIIYFCHH